MPLYRIDCRNELVKSIRDRSPYIVIETDGDSPDGIPPDVRSIAHRTTPKELTGFQSAKLPREADGVITWLNGDRLLSGTAACILDDLHHTGRRSFVPVHISSVEEMPLIALQPRWLRGGNAKNYWNFNLRIGSSDSPSDLTIQTLAGNNEAWARLSAGLLNEQIQPGTGIATLTTMWEEQKEIHPMLAALVLRNLAVLMIKSGETAKTEQVLGLGVQTYPGYADLKYLTALFYLLQDKPAKVMPFLERARSGDRAFLGCGGESSYRIDWITGLLAARVGNQRVAFASFHQAMMSIPVFAPAVRELLKLRLPPSLVEAHQWDFCRVARREPRLAQELFEFLLLHNTFAAARCVCSAVSDDDHRAILLDRLESAAAPPQKPPKSSSKTEVVLSGPFFEYSSLARINREIAANLSESPGITLRLEPSALSSQPAHVFAGSSLLEPAILRHASTPQLTIRHQWPPDFRRPQHGKLAVILPWEYSTIPRVWLAQIQSNVDELWVPSRFVRDVFVRCGVNPDRVIVIPNGADTRIFTPEGPTLRPQGARKFVFFFMGGAIRRKGVDLLIEAYKSAFDAGEDVSLVLSLSGSAGAYQHNGLTQRLTEMARTPGSPHVQFLFETFDDTTLASLYRGCDAFVLPYRGEGFGMPLLEAMACGRTVITTVHGPSRDFCCKQNAYLVSAREELVDDEPPPLGELVGDFTWFEPDFADLVRTMRQAYEHPEETMRRGRCAAKSVRHKYSWPHISNLYRERVLATLDPETDNKINQDAVLAP
jgi:glycosyltransferase involved in cell wall biosynthesis